MSPHRPLCNALALALALAAAPVLAQDGPQPTPGWTLGVLAIERNAPYRQLDEGLLVVPLVRFEGERFYLRGLRGGVVLAEDGGFAFGAFAQVRGDGYKADDSPFLAGMDDRDFSLDLGLAASWRVKGVGQFEASLATDMLDRSGGQEAAVSWTGLVRAGGWRLLPGVSVAWQSEDMIDYYYGVRPGEALVGRPVYSPGSAIIPEVSLLATHPVGERWEFFARAGHAWLPSEITNSPLVDQDGRLSVIVGLGYTFD
ncbi:MAG: MipA/OmpV family protein [Pseudomonadota bacterium]